MPKSEEVVSLTMLECPAIDYEDVVSAAERLFGHAHLTQVATSREFNGRASRNGLSRELFFKCENLQRVGAFKFRGAYNAVSQIAESDRSRGVVTHSSGNHAQAMALAAKSHGIPAWVVMPVTAPSVKRQAVLGYGATVVDCQPTLESRSSVCAEVQRETGATFIHPFDNPHVMAGQGTAALELVNQVPDLDLIIAPVGGGGLISGTAIVAAHHGIDVIAAEPVGADDAARSKRMGERLPSENPDTIADGLLTGIGELTWPVLRDLVCDVITVDDAGIIQAMRDFWERVKLVIEPSAAVAVAVALSDTVLDNPKWRRIGVILSGGNVDLGKLPW